MLQWGRNAHGLTLLPQFGSGNGVFVPTEEDPTQFASGAPVVAFPAPPSPAVSHPHMALEVGEEIFVPDLVRTLASFVNCYRNGGCCGVVPTVGLVCTSSLADVLLGSPSPQWVSYRRVAAAISTACPICVALRWLGTPELEMRRQITIALLDWICQ